MLKVDTMASGQSPQRSRKSQQVSGTTGHGNQQLREGSPSPNLAKAQRSMRTQSMPLVPSVMQMFSNGSPTQRLLPTPPHAEDNNSPSMNIKRLPGGAGGGAGGGGSPAQPQPRTQEVMSRQFLAKFRALDANYELTEQLLKEVEASGESQARPALHSNTSAPALFDGGSSEGMRRDFHPSVLLNNIQRSSSPSFLSPLGERPPPFASPRVQPQQIAQSNTTTTMRSPRSSQDRSLPVQEEDGDVDTFHEHYAGSPVPSSDLHPEDKPLPTSSSSEEGDGSFTPRSPVSSLPANHPNNHIYIQQLARGRGGAMDRVPLQGLDAAAAMFESQSNDGSAMGLNAEEMAIAAQQYLDEYFNHYYAGNADAAAIRPDAPIPPTPPSQATPSPYPHPPIAGSPYPYPYTHLRRPGPPSTIAPTPSQAAEPMQALDPASIHASLVRQWQIYASNRAYEDMQSEVSTLSPAGTPAIKGPERFNPWAQWHASKILGRNRWTGKMQHNGMGGDMADWRSIQSSPSHEPVVQRSFPRPTRKHSGSGGTGGSGSGGGGGGGGRDQKKNVPAKRKPPPRVASTQPRDTSPEPSSSGDDDSGDDTSVVHDSPHEEVEVENGPQFAIVEEGKWVSNGGRRSSSTSASKRPSPVLVEDADDDADDDEGEWVDEDDSDEDDLLALEYHPTFIRNVEKRRKRFDVRWEALVEAFQALDRQTDATMILLAAPSHTSKMHALTSRSIKRSSSQRSPEVSKLKSNFTSLATSMRSKRPPSSSSSLAFSDASTLNSESDLRRALETALGSLTALGGMWDERETRWKEEMKRAGEERERVEGLLRGVLGERMRD